ncbi:glycoside hydrolase family 65 protein [Vagococcus humatus]|uniref:Glycoside hydrolase family 65 protein n=1 Tax=Vagococcus humatus TaxID=1889241 RepID=A0A429Z806_9ENTE|nr:glycosyl hydrolase family 65 protein [Vagococcus humatus]RST89849.1 glycoside hydrolase family 65 protein [Vagococcus humatus]
MKWLSVEFKGAHLSTYHYQNETCVGVNTYDNPSFEELFIALKKEPIEGIMLKNYPSEMSQEKQTAFCQEWMEKLNIPVVMADMLSKELSLSEQFQQIADEYTWQLTYTGYQPGKTEYCVESLLTVGNGFMGLRGTTPEMEISKNHYPATYLASLYDEAKSTVAGHEVVNEDFVNAPNLQGLTVKLDDEDYFKITSDNVKNLTRHLDLKTGLFTSEMIAYLPKGKLLKIKTSRIANMKHWQQYSMQYEVTPLNFSAHLTIVSISEGDVYNYNVERYRSLQSHHLSVTDTYVDSRRSCLLAKTKTSDIQIAQVSTLHLSKTLKDSQVTYTRTAKQTTHCIRFFANCQETYQLDKTVFIEKRQAGQHLTLGDFLAKEKSYQNFQTNYKESATAWGELWEQSDIQIEGDMMSQKMLRLHTFHLLVSASPYSNPHLDASVTARGLHGEAYRGHVFWDEIYILPFYVMHYPKTAKQLLMYRYNRLNQAKIAAKEAGYKGAMFPWQSGLDGSEQSQKIHLNPLSGEWGPDHSRLQRHVSLAIAYNVWFYWHNTQDQTFMEMYGLELLLEIAKFWLSVTRFDSQDNRYHIEGVMGPDEFHEAYPNSEKGGLKDNAYTNMMVVWLFEELENLTKTVSLETLSSLYQRTQVTVADLEKMKKIRAKLALAINSDGIIAQYDGYLSLKEIDWQYYRKKYQNIYRMDRILGAEGKSADDYQVTKQADTLMLFYNFNQTQIDLILDDLGYHLPDDYLKRNLTYYLKRTSHGSTLSRIVHAKLAQEVGHEELAWQLYQEALFSDYQDIQGGTTAEGIHAGVMAATLYVTLTTFGGLDLREDIIQITPDLPTHWKKLAFNFTHRNIDYRVVMTQEELTIKSSEDSMISICGKHYSLVKEKTLEIII